MKSSIIASPKILKAASLKINPIARSPSMTSLVGPHVARRSVVCARESIVGPISGCHPLEARYFSASSAVCNLCFLLAAASFMFMLLDATRFGRWAMGTVVGVDQGNVAFVDMTNFWSYMYL